MGGGAREVDSTIAACRQNRAMRQKAMQRPVLQIPGEQAAANAVVIHQQIERKIFNEELRAVLQALLIHRMQDGMAGTIRRSTGALRHLLAEVDGLAAERSLVDFAFSGARERHAVMLEFQDGRYSLAAHILDSVLVAEPVGALDSVVHVKTPIVAIAHIAKRSGHSTLC